MLHYCIYCELEYLLQKCPYCGELIFYREKGHMKEDKCELRKKLV